MDVNPVQSITSLTYGFILIATVDSLVAERVKKELRDLGVSSDKILTIAVPENKEQLIKRFLDEDAIVEAEAKRKREVSSHA